MNYLKIQVCKMYEIKTTTKFEKDLKLIKKRGYDLKFLKEVIEILSNGDYKMNNYIKLNEDRWNNVKNDYLLIYCKKS